MSLCINIVAHMQGQARIMGDEVVRLRRSPPDSKRLSYERDCVNVYRENDKSSRKSIRRFNAASNRVGRHGAKVAVSRFGTDDAERADVALAEAERLALKPSKTKRPDQPLGIKLKKIPDGKRKRRLARADFPRLR
jgi:hypothetical protein